MHVVSKKKQCGKDMRGCRFDLWQRVIPCGKTACHLHDWKHFLETFMLVCHCLGSGSRFCVGFSCVGCSAPKQP